MTTAKTSSTPAETVPEVSFPVDTYKDAAVHLRRPFTAAAVRFKVQAATPRDNPTRALVVTYIDARLVIERLNMVVPHLWHDAYRAGGNPKALWCDLTIDGITRSDVGEASDSEQGSSPKALVSDALKRAAVKFGVGVSLYAMPQIWLDVATGTVKQKTNRNGKTLEMTPKGEASCRDAYTRWLDQRGRDAYGPPLDHGDVFDSAGDYETRRPAEDLAFPPADVPLDGAQASDVTSSGADPRTGPVTADEAARPARPAVGPPDSRREERPNSGEFLLTEIKGQKILAAELKDLLASVNAPAPTGLKSRAETIAYLDGLPDGTRMALANALVLRARDRGLSTAKAHGLTVVDGGAPVAPDPVPAGA
jgi:hypothetical protein